MIRLDATAHVTINAYELAKHLGDTDATFQATFLEEFARIAMNWGQDFPAIQVRAVLKELHGHFVVGAETGDRTSLWQLAEIVHQQVKDRLPVDTTDRYHDWIHAVVNHHTTDGYATWLTKQRIIP